MSFEDLTYAEYFQHFRLQKLALHKPDSPMHFLELSNPSQQPIMSVVQRGPKNHHVSCIQPISPSQGERFYICTLLLMKSTRYFDDLRTVDGVTMSSFQEAAKQFGLFIDECEDVFTLREAVSLLYTPKQLHNLFVDILTNDCCILPISIWNTLCMELAKDFTLKYSDEEKALNLCLESPCTHGLPQPISYASEVTQEYDCWCPLSQDLELHCQRAITSFNPQQRMVFSEIDYAMSACIPLLAFVNGGAGTGKTFLLTACCNRARSRHKIVLATATSAFAAQLYPGGRTTHAVFKASIAFFLF